MSITQDELDRLMRVSRTFSDAYWREFAKVGPRHANVKRWSHDLGWSAAPGVFEAYLAAERPNG